MRKSLFIGTMIAGLSVVALAAAQPPHGPGGHGGPHGLMAFDQLDTDGDGVLSPAEQEAGRKAAFARMDVDGDGYLTEADRATMKEKMDEKKQAFREKMEEKRADHQAALDENGDGKISEAEFLAEQGKMQAMADADGDGSITKAEAEAAMQAMRKEMMEKRGQWKAKKGGEEI